MTQIYKVTYAIDYMDSNPIVKYFDLFDEAENWLHEEVQNRVQWYVDHNPYMISEQERQEQEELEYSLAKLETADHDIVEWFKHYTNWEHQKIIDHVL